MVNVVPQLINWCACDVPFLALVPSKPHRILQNHQVQLGPESNSLRWINIQGSMICPHFARIVTTVVVNWNVSF